MPVLAGNYPETCFAKYGTLSLKNSYFSEMALRSVEYLLLFDVYVLMFVLWCSILLHTIETAANKYKKYIVPWISGEEYSLLCLPCTHLNHNEQFPLISMSESLFVFIRSYFLCYFHSSLSPYLILVCLCLCLCSQRLRLKRVVRSDVMFINPLNVHHSTSNQWLR